MSPVAKALIFAGGALTMAMASGIALADAKPDCKWCVSGDDKVAKEIIALAELPPKKLISSVRSRGVCVKVVETHRKAAPGAFSWGKIQKPNVTTGQVARFSSQMGKLVCKGELPVAASCDTVFVATDAPYSTLIREYLHFIQAKRDRDWCTQSKMLWRRAATHEDWVAIRNREWDVQKFLWSNRDKLPYAKGDKIAVATTLLNEAQERSGYDPAAMKYVQKEKTKEYLDQALK